MWIGRINDFGCSGGSGFSSKEEITSGLLTGPTSTWLSYFCELRDDPISLLLLSWMLILSTLSCGLWSRGGYAPDRGCKSYPWILTLTCNGSFHFCLALPRPLASITRSCSFPAGKTFIRCVRLPKFLRLLASVWGAVGSLALSSTICTLTDDGLGLLGLKSNSAAVIGLLYYTKAPYTTRCLWSVCW